MKTDSTFQDRSFLHRIMKRKILGKYVKIFRNEFLKSITKFLCRYTPSFVEQLNYLDIQTGEFKQI